MRIPISTSFSHHRPPKFYCPYCRSIEIRRIARSGYADFFGWLFGFFPWYCDACGQLFSARRRFPEKEQLPQKTHPQAQLDKGQAA